jgi:hypothetical protein
MSRIDVCCIKDAVDPRHEYHGPLEGHGPQVKNRCFTVYSYFVIILNFDMIYCYVVFMIFRNEMGNEDCRTNPYK